MTLVFVPKIIVVFAALAFLLPFMLTTISEFMIGLGDKIIGLG